ncbi:MAG: type VI secretion system baseplate subunit TssF, partial [Gemmataceae bacterium]
TSLTHTLLPATALRQVGFERDEGMLPYPARSQLGYRLLTEYFAFPSKFLFVDLTGLAGAIPKEAGSRVHVFVYLGRDERLERATIDLEQYVDRDTFRLGCSPAVNLYRMMVGPVKMDPTRYEYRIVPDPRNLKAHEVYTLDDRINATDDHGNERDYHPLFSTQHGRADGAYWVSSRRPAVPEEGEVDKGTDVYLSLVDLEQKREPADGWTLDVHATCLNRDLPERLPFGGDALPLAVEGAAGVAKVEALTGFTRTHRPAMRRGALWRLISHLSLNHLSLLDNGDEAEALREVLRLYEFTGDPQASRLIAGVTSVKAERVVARPAGAICRGVQITVVFDEANYAGHELFLFACVLERFFGRYCTLNSFTKMVAKIKGGRETLHEWQPRAGERVLV